MSKRGEKTHWDADNKSQAEPLPLNDAELKKVIKVGDWNDVVLKVEGNHVTYKINRHVTTELTDESPKALKEGVLALQMHQGYTMEIQFKDIRLKKLGETESRSDTRHRCFVIRIPSSSRYSHVSTFVIFRSPASP